MDEIEALFPVQFAGDKVNADLPEVVIEVHPAVAPFPELQTGGQIVINEMNII